SGAARDLAAERQRVVPDLDGIGHRIRVARSAARVEISAVRHRETGGRAVEGRKYSSRQLSPALAITRAVGRRYLDLLRGAVTALVLRAAQRPLCQDGAARSGCV